MLSGYTRPIYMVYLVYLTCGKPPRNKGILEAKCWEAYSAATWQYGLCLDHIGCWNLVIWTVGGSGMIGWNASICLREGFWKVLSWETKSGGESAQPLQMEKSKYLAKSLVMDNLSIKTWKLSRISSSQFLSKNLWVNKGEGPQCLLVVPWESFDKEKLSDFI